ncbi:MAG: proline--tRNA ligase, partial [Vicinamibacteria bacterium]
MENDRVLKEITPKSRDHSQWYLDVVLKADMADYGPVKGCMIIKPYGYSVWETMQRDMDRRIKETGHVNAYFPLLIPKSFLEKEKEHVEGFSPECAWVTVGGGEELEEPLAIRPTSEAMICSMYAKWVQSWRDLPVLINQWANVVRWEKVTRPFLRTTEFLWQEGHTLHETEEEAEEETLKMLEVYRSFSEEMLAMPVVWGRKSESEKFAGALRTYAIEALMGDGKSLQAGTSHNLGQHFATAYGIEYLDRDQKRAKPWSTSWGTSTRMIGGLIMTHGDDAGLILPPKVAPYQVVIVPIPPRKGGDWNETILPKAREVAAMLRGAGFRVHLDDRDQFQTGYKYSDWEMRGVPVRLEIGPKDVAKEQCVLVRRDNRAKDFVPLAGVAERLGELLDTLQKDLLERARQFTADNTTRVLSYDEFKEVMKTKRGFILAGWNGDPAVEARIKEETKATIRIIPTESEREAPCVVTG